MEVQGSRIVVTGAGRGVGKALALAFAREGAKVACLARSREELAQTAAEIAAAGGEARVATVDVTDESQVTTTVREIEAAWDGIDVLYNNAGSFAALGALHQVDLALWWQDVAVNLLGVVHCCRAVLPGMISRGQGVIINMSGGNRIPGGTGYSCSKVAVDRLTELLAKEQEQLATGVLVVGMGPGFVQTRMTELQVSSEAGRQWLPSSSEAIAAGRDRPPEDCAETSLALLRAACPEMNGKLFGVDSEFSSYLR